MTKLYSPKLGEALQFAADAFRERPRKGSGVPYLTHLLQVSTWVGEHGGDEELMIAGVLHDYLEDIDPEGGPELERRFGARVARLVAALSELGSKRDPWRKRKEEYIERLRTAPVEVKLIAAADKLHNARSVLRDFGLIGDEIWKRFTAGKGESLWYYATVTAAVGEGFPHPLVSELESTVKELLERAE
jgi:(p)ppGpp synthase/HD superfamily hydrolase